MKHKIELTLDFKRNPYSGLYIALEGIDGAGKTVQLERLAGYFRERNDQVVTTTEPRRTGMIGSLINEFLEKRVTLPLVSLQYLFSADRVTNQTEVIIPTLQKKGIAITHRCFWSALPYGILERSGQGYDINESKILLVAQSILSMYHQFIIPDITFYLDISAQTALTRLKKKELAPEFYETKDKLLKVRKGYEWMVNKFPDEFIRIDGDRDPQEVFNDIVAFITEFEKNRKTK